MQKNSLYRNDETIIRILDISENRALIIDCIRLTVPRWIDISELSVYSICTETELCKKTNIFPRLIDDLDADSRRYAYEHYTIINVICNGTLRACIVVLQFGGKRRYAETENHSNTKNKG